MLDKLIPYFDVRYSYVEPFFGGGAVFCWMMDNYKFLKVIINDTNTELMGIYRSIRDNPQEFIRQTTDYQEAYLDVSYSERRQMFYSLRQEYWSTQKGSTLYFLMLISFNGAWASNKASGGLYGGSFGDSRYTKEFVDEENIYSWSKALEKVEMTTVDFEELAIPKNSLVYCDPPYINSNVDYGSPFTLEDQKRCFGWCRKINQDGASVVLSNKTDGVFFERMVQGEREHIKYFDFYHTSGRGLKKAIEMIIVFG